MKKKILGLFLAVLLMATHALPLYAVNSSPSLSPLQVENLALLCKTWGLVKFYHPECLTSSEKMDQALLSLIPEVEKAASREECDAILLKWVKSLPAAVQMPIKNESSEAAESYNIIFSKNYDGDRWINALSSDLKVQLKAIINADRRNIKNFKYFDQWGFHTFDHESQYLDLKTIDKNHRLLSLFRFWNVFEFFSPNKDILDQNWDAVLLELIPSFYGAENSLDYEEALMTLSRKTNDGHAGVLGASQCFKNKFGTYIAPFVLLNLEGNIVAQIVREVETPIKTGDIITHINGVSAKELLNATEHYAYSNITGKNSTALYCMRFSKQEKNQISILREGVAKTLTIDYIPQSKYQNIDGSEITPIEKIEKDVYYANYGHLTPETEAELIQHLKTAKTLIFDLREYPMNYSASNVLNHVLPYQKNLVEFELTLGLNLGSFYKIMSTSELIDNPDFYKGELICLVNDETQSHTEFTALQFRKAPKAITMGSQTAGADGDIVAVPLVGPYSINYSSFGIHDIDGSETQRLGVKVDVPQIQTYKGFLKGEDDLLNAALAYAKKLNAHKVETRKIKGIEMVPLKQALTHRPYTIQYDAQAKTFTLTNGAEKTTITLGKNTYPRFDGASITLKSEPVVLNGSLYVPKEYLMQVLSLKLSFK